MKKCLNLLWAVIFAGCVPVGGNIQVSKTFGVLGKECQAAEIELSWSAEQLITVCGDKVDPELQQALVKAMENLNPEEKKLLGKAIAQMAFSGSWQMVATAGRPTAQTITDLIKAAAVTGALIYGAGIINDTEFGTVIDLGGIGGS